MSSLPYRALTVVSAAVLALAGSVVTSPAARAADVTVYVDPTGVDEGGCGGGPGRACQTIGFALGSIQPGDAATVSVASGTYTEPNVSVTVPVTLVGHGAVLDGTLDIGNANGTVDVSGFTLSGPGPAAVSVHDTVAGAAVALHDNTVEGATDGIDVTGAAAYSITANTFRTGGGSAIVLDAPDPTDTLAVTLGGNSGTVAAGGHTISEPGSGTVTITTSAANTLTAEATSLSSSDPPPAVTTHEAPVQFAVTAASTLALSSPRYGVAVTSAGLGPGDLTLQYSTDGGTTFGPVPLIGAPGSLSGSLPDGAGVPSSGSATTTFRLSAGDTAPAGPIDVVLSLDELGPSGSVVNTPAALTLPVSVVANSPPVAQDVTVGVARNASGVPVALSATDADADPITGWTVVSPPGHGATSGSGPDLTYTPDPQYSGPDSFTYTASDGKGGTSGIARVSITVGPDAAPVASAPGQVTVGYQTATAIPLSGSDPDLDPLSYTLTTPAHGTLGPATSGSLDPTGRSVTYTPDAKFSGFDSFDYTVSDGTRSDTVTVHLLVGPDSAPVATAPPRPVDVGFETTSAVIDLAGTDPDGDPLTYTLSPPGHGTLNSTTPSAGPLPSGGLHVTYTPTGRFSGGDSFTFTVSDGVDTSTAIIALDVGPDTSPTATGFTAAGVVPYGSTGVTLDLAGHAHDVDPLDVLTFTVSGQSVEGGTVTLDGSQVTYVPPPSTDGHDSFQFAAFDGSQWSPWALVTLAVDRPPVAATPPGQHVIMGHPVAITLHATDADSGDTVTFAVPATPLRHGSVALSGDHHQIATFTAPTDWAGTTSFTFTADDGHGGTSTATATVQVLRAPSTLSMTLTPARPTSARHAKLVVRVSSAGDVSTGTVTVGTGYGPTRGRVINGAAQVTLPDYPGGQHTIWATFGGTPTAAPVTSRVTRTFTVTSVASSPKVGIDPPQLTTATTNAVATVRVVAPLVVHTGLVTIADGGRRLVSAAVRNGVATLHLPRFGLGQHNLTVGFSGTPYVKSSSVVVVERVALG